jgi:hypothetical protein
MVSPPSNVQLCSREYLPLRKSGLVRFQVMVALCSDIKYQAASSASNKPATAHARSSAVGKFRFSIAVQFILPIRKRLPIVATGSNGVQLFIRVNPSTDASRLFIRNIALCFDNTLAPVGERKHSKTI